MSCRDCNGAISTQKPHMKCSNCGFDVHLDCIGVTKEFASCLTRSKLKNVIVLCSRCESQESKLDRLIKQLEARDKKLDDLAKKLDDIHSNFETRISSLEKSYVNLSSPTNDNLKEDLIQETTERLKRASNVIITKLPEVSPEEDLEAVKDVIRLVTGSSVNVSAHRLGRHKEDQDRIRPLKVVVDNPDTVLKILKNKKKLLNTKYKKLSIFNDQTPKQRDFLTQIRNELKDRIDKGEKDITIKYVNGSPTIVNVNVSKK